VTAATWTPLGAATAKDRLLDPFTGGTVAPVGQASEVPDLDLGGVLLDGRDVDYRVERAVTDATIERTIEGASTFTLKLLDEGPAHQLLNSKLFDSVVDLKLDRLWFELAKVSKTGDDLELTFEDREIAWLRRYKGAKKAYRDSTTRAEFVVALLREVKEGRIRYHIPELHKKQPAAEIKKTSDRPTPRQRQESRSGGLGPGENLKVRGEKATPYQLHMCERVLDVAESMGLRRKLRVAGIAVIIEESGARNLDHGDRDSLGLFQQRPSQGWGTPAQVRDPEHAAKAFFDRAVEADRQNPRLSIAELAFKVQVGASVSLYNKYVPEADAIVSAYGGGSGSTTSESRTVTRIKRYAFTRGRHEDSWTAILRLAEEVGWRAFMVRGRLYFISEHDLFRSQPLMRLSETSDGVQWIDFDFDRGKPAAEATVHCHAPRWFAPPGSVVVLEDSGPANGRWLVKTITRSLFNTDAEIALGKPIAEKPEPAPETDTETLSGRARGGSISISGGAAAHSRSDRLNRAYAKLKAISDKNYAYSWGGGHNPGFSPGGPHHGYDCSGYISAGLHAGDMLDSPETSGGLMNWGAAGPGRLMTVYASPNHVFAHFYGPFPEKRADTSPHGDGGNGPHLRAHHREHGGFAARHWPGL
jgi:hypothetical protein